MKWSDNNTILKYYYSINKPFYKIDFSLNLNKWEAPTSNFLITYFFFVDFLQRKNKLRRNKKRSYLMNKDLTIANQFIKILTKKGLLYRYQLVISKIVGMHRSYFEIVNPILNETYSQYYIYYMFSKKHIEFFNLNILLDMAARIVDPLLQVKVVTLPKFLQKKYKKRFDFKIKHVNLSVRLRYVLKRIILNSDFLKKRDVQDRLYDCIMGIFLNPQLNLVYEEKLYFYKYALKMYKTNKLKLNDV
jgi:hypothetical protein